jgi:hypothetical protein
MASHPRRRHSSGILNLKAGCSSGTLLPTYKNIQRLILPDHYLCIHQREDFKLPDSEGKISMTEYGKNSRLIETPDGQREDKPISLKILLYCGL